MMSHPLEAAAAAAMQAEVKLKQELTAIKDELKNAEHKISVLLGKVEALEAELAATQTRSDHYLRWNSEITMQLHNINMFVQDAMEQARIHVKPDGKEQPQAMLSVENAIKDMRPDEKSLGER
jgi:predicted  nucleic acid-binding Zn-ribbon protein